MDDLKTEFRKNALRAGWVAAELEKLTAFLETSFPGTPMVGKALEASAFTRQVEELLGVLQPAVPKAPSRPVVTTAAPDTAKPLEVSAKPPQRRPRAQE